MCLLLLVPRVEDRVDVTGMWCVMTEHQDPTKRLRLRVRAIQLGIFSIRRTHSANRREVRLAFSTINYGLNLQPRT
jgi:hypothetical protein